MKIFLAHIPKNTGTSIGEYLIDQFGSDNFFGIDCCNETRMDFFKYTEDIIDKYQIIGGHVPLLLIEEFISRFDAVVSVVRDPWQRLLSVANYLRRDNRIDASWTFEEFIRKYYFNNVATRNEQCSYIGFSNSAPSVMERLKTFDNIYLLRQNNIQNDFSLFCRQVGIPVGTLPHSNKLSEKDKHFSLAEVMTRQYFTHEVASWFEGDFALHSYLTSLDDAMK